MDKIKKVLSPGSSKDDEVLYGDAEARRASATEAGSQQTVPSTVANDAQLQTDPGKKDHSILRQIINPQGEKYDEQAYGSTAHVAGDKDAQAIRSDPVTNPDSSIKRQILNPGQDKYDPVVHGTAGAPATSTTAPSQGTPAPVSQAQGLATPGSCLSVKSGIEGPFARQADSPSAGVGSTTETLPDRTATTGESSTLARDATIGGAGAAAAGGAGYYAATRDNPDEKITDRPHPLSDRAADTHINPVTAPSETTATAGSTGVASESTTVGGAHINPVGAPEESLNSGTANLERNAAVGAGAGGITAAAGSTQLNSAPADVEKATYTDRAYPVGGGYQHTTGPHQTDIANILDPHVPGEFPAEDGTDKHGINNPPLGAAVATDGPVSSTSTGQRDALGTAAAAAGTGGLVGAGAAAATHGQSSTTSATSHPGGASYPIQTTTNTLSSAPASAQGTSGIAAGETTEKSSEHNYGRDAGIAAGAAGAGAAGYGVYEATKDREDTGPASKTIGPHESNIANVVDPRVQPEPEKMKESKTVGPHSSDIANKADPRVESDPAKAEEKEGTTARDAALVGGGAAAAGAATYAATRGEGSNTAQAPPQQPQGGHTVYILTEPTTLKPREPGYDQPKPAKTTESEKSSEKGEKKHGLLHRILHPGEAKREKEEEKRRRSIEESSSGTLNHPLVGAADVREGRISTDEQPKAANSIPPPTNTKLSHPLVTADDVADNRISTDEQGHNKLHKKSVEQGAAAVAVGEAGSSAAPRHVGTDGPIGRDDQVSGLVEAHRKSAEESARTTTIGDTNTSATPRHIGTDGAIGRDNEVSGALDPTTGRQDETVIEPHTGLPMNVGKYGVGSGGTDGAQQISGYHETDPAVRAASIGTGQGAGVKGATTHAPGEEGVAGPDWEAIKKANTPY